MRNIWTAVNSTTRHAGARITFAGYGPNEVAFYWGTGTNGEPQCITYVEYRGRRLYGNETNSWVDDDSSKRG